MSDTLSSCITESHLGDQLEEEIKQAALALLAQQKSLQLATSQLAELQLTEALTDDSVSASQENTLLASYSPFVKVNDRLYIFISELAQHTQNLLATGKASVMLIEDERDAKNIFARKRLVLQCDAKDIDRSHAFAEEVLDTMSERLGNTLSVLRTLPDFHLFELLPVSGHYVQGFGQAFEL